jgi:DNA mismatch repair protein MutL
MEVGYQLYTEGGENPSVSEIGMGVGTTIEARNIFFNTPAREKFLKSKRSEESEVSSVISKFILANSNIKFIYYSDNKLVLQSFGDGFESAMAQVFGINTINDCFNIDATKNGLGIKGYISKHHFTKGNRTHQYVFLNGRIITNQTISAAITNAYAPYLTKGRFPFYALNISVPYEIIDVNVHPNKSDVRFSNNQIIYSSIYSLITKILDGSSEAVNIISEQDKDFDIDSATLNERIGFVLRCK